MPFPSTATGLFPVVLFPPLPLDGGSGLKADQHLRRQGDGVQISGCSFHSSVRSPAQRSRSSYLVAAAACTSGSSRTEVIVIGISFFLIPHHHASLDAACSHPPRCLQD
ncbi:hypothetical protein E2562_009073 [Oryza meyeriana var. granulata]|uniref:Uncharacterized protein n=1 Tax=Oryza meyeriana var. granulata TaxID=110450 RepID=A0A6G1CZK3_9ORYZ|nr:hypothetical protein E2562_009073 [Oryza meyeriana var. granulata]